MISHITDIAKFPTPSRWKNESNNLKSCGHNNKLHQVFFVQLYFKSEKPCKKDFWISNWIPNSQSQRNFMAWKVTIKT